jgi:adenylylsulfate kinase-like enzyme
MAHFAERAVAYRMDGRGKLAMVTRIDSPIESPESLEIAVNTVECRADKAAEKNQRDDATQMLIPMFVAHSC